MNVFPGRGLLFSPFTHVSQLPPSCFDLQLKQQLGTINTVSGRKCASVCMIIKCKVWFSLCFAGQLCHDYCATAHGAQYEEQLAASVRPSRCLAPRSTAGGRQGPGGAVRRANEVPLGPQPCVRSRAALSQPGLPGRNVEMYNVLLLLHDETNVKTKNV